MLARMSDRLRESHRTSLDAVLAELGALRADVGHMRTLLEKALHAVPPRTWLSIEEAAELADRTPQCVRGWCAVEAIGTRVKGRWQVDRAGLRRVMLDRCDGDEARLPVRLANVQGEPDTPG
jgi:hypothetical protein